MGAGGAEFRDFLGVVDRIYAGDPHYIRPLDMDLKERLDPKKNPFFEHAEGTIFTAHDGASASAASPRRSTASTSIATRTDAASSASSTRSTTPRSRARCSRAPSRGSASAA